MSAEDLERTVASTFKVKDTFVVEDGSREYKVSYDEGTRSAFMALLGKAGPLGYVPRLFGTREDATLVLAKEPRPSQATPRASVFLFFITIASIIATGWALGDIYVEVFPNGSPYLTAVGFIVGVVAVLLGHDVVQRLMARRVAKGATLPYYLPNLPLFIGLPVLYFLPTFGAITFLRSPAVDRNSLFDFYFIAPVVGAVIALAVALAGAMSPIVLTHAQYAQVFGSGKLGTLSTNPSLLQGAAISLVDFLGLSPRVPGGGVSLFSPVEIAAWLGFLLVFFSLLPAALLDGGRMAKLVLGDRGSRVTTTVVALVLVLVDVPNYWVIFLLIFLLAAIQPSFETLDSITGLSRSRKGLFVLAMLLALLCAPIPQSFATFAIP